MTVGASAVNTANKFLDLVLRASAWTPPAGCFMKLHIGDPGAAGATNPSVGSATRVAVSHAAAASGSSVITGTAPAWTNGGTSETLTHVSYWDAITAGNFIESAVLTTAKAWASGDTYSHTTDTWSIGPVAA